MDGWNTSFLFGWPIFSGYICQFQGVYITSRFCWYCSVNPNPWRCRKPLTKRFKQEILVQHQPLPRGGGMFFLKMFGPPDLQIINLLRSTKTAKSHRVRIIQEIFTRDVFNCIDMIFLFVTCGGLEMHIRFQIAMFIFALYGGVIPTFTVPGKLENSPTSHIPPQVGHVFFSLPRLRLVLSMEKNPKANHLGCTKLRLMDEVLHQLI